MGGKAAMVLALTEPARVRRLVVADMAPVAYEHSQIGYVRAMQAVDLAAVARRADADAALAAAVPEPALRAFFLQSLALGAGRRRAGSSTSPRSPTRCRGSWPSPTSPAASTARRCS